MAYTLLALGSTLFRLALCYPTAQNIKLPQVHFSNAHEINNLKYQPDDINVAPENIKLFTQLGSNIEKSANYIDKTVREVEKLLNENSSLPRLTRGEILEIIENITKADLITEQKQIDNSKERNQKAVMLVMPYTPENMDVGKMQELFTKPPITKIVGEPSESSKLPSKIENKRRRRPHPQTPAQGTFVGEVFQEPLIVEEKPTKTLEKKPSSLNQKPYKFPVYTQKPLTTTKQSTTATITHKPFIEELTTRKQLVPETSSAKSSIEELFIEKTNHRQASTPNKPRTTSTEISVIVGNKIPKPQAYALQQRRRPLRPPQRHPNHKYPDDKESTTFRPNGGLNIVEPPQLITAIAKQQEKFSLPTVPPAKPSKPHRFTTGSPVLEEINLPDDLKATLENLNLDTSSINDLPVKFKPYDVEHNFPPAQPNVKEVLASLGVILPSSTTTTTTIPDISYVADTLTPDMRQLLMNFGLLPDPNEKPTMVKEEEPIGIPTADISSTSYVRFKPLPSSGPPRHEMGEFLSRFGLGRDTKIREQKALNAENDKPEKVLTELPHIEEGMLPEPMKFVLEDLGLAARKGKEIPTTTVGKALVESSSEQSQIATKNQHIFNPGDTPYATKDELDKLNQLLDIIKQLEKLNGTATEEDLSKVDLKNIKELVGSLNKDESVPLDDQEWAPNPINYDFGLAKNEVKRQQNGSSTTETVVTVTAASATTSRTTTTTTTEQPSTPSIKDLEDSFGGPSDTAPRATLPPPTEAPKTGFYYLLDWNSFLDIDDQKGKRVNLRFQPHVGDPKRFYSVSVP